MIALDMIAFFWIRLFRTVQVIWERLMCLLSNRGQRRQRRQFRTSMKKCKTYQAWRGYAAELDKLEKNDVWRSKYESTAYDFEVLRAQIEHLRILRKDSKRYPELLSTLRGMLSRSYAGLNAKELFGSSHLGTKHLVEQFQEEVKTTLHHVSNEPSFEILPAHERAQFFHHAKHSYGRTALCLSGGGALTMYHMGVVRSLINNQVMPSVISGTSGGSIVAGMLARYTDKEMIKHVLIDNISTKYGVRWFEPFPIQLRHFLIHGTLADPKTFAATCRAYYGDYTFGEAYKHSKRIVSICVTCRGKSNGGSHPRLLNYLTSPDVMLWSAVHASCALPGLMPSVQLMARNTKTGNEVPFLPGQAVADGSINADLPMQRLAELFNVNNFIVSQVNPHVNPFIASHEINSNPGRNNTRTLSQHIEYLLNIDVQHRCRKLAKIGLFPRVFGNNMSGVFVQRYVGNVTIAPPLSIMDNFRAIQHPSILDMKRYLLVGAQTTWPKLDTIRHMMLLETELCSSSKKWNRINNRNNNRRNVNTTDTLSNHSSSPSSAHIIQNIPVPPHLLNSSLISMGEEEDEEPNSRSRTLSSLLVTPENSNNTNNRLSPMINDDNNGRRTPLQHPPPSFDIANGECNNDVRKRR
jgi:TAG lipase/steryl ester hydrolase/phospholipase A2/LPA acyltransferase